jgi:hypothetical protein
MATYTFTITSNNGVLQGSGVTVPDWSKTGSGHYVANKITFQNNTKQTVILTGAGTSWKRYFSQSSISIAVKPPTNVTLKLNLTMSNSSDVGYSLRYRDTANRNSEDNPSITITKGEGGQVP